MTTKKPCVEGGYIHNVMKYGDGVTCCADCGMAPNAIRQQQEELAQQEWEDGALERANRRVALQFVSKRPIF